MDSCAVASHACECKYKQHGTELYGHISIGFGHSVLGRGLLGLFSTWTKLHRPSCDILGAPMDYTTTETVPCSATSITNSTHPLQRSTECITEDVCTEEGDKAQHHWDWLLRTESSGNRGRSEDERSQEGELKSIRLTVLETVTTKGVFEMSVSR